MQSLIAGILLCVPASAQINIDAYRDYFLVGRFGEVCTMCEITVLCESALVRPEYAQIPAKGSFTVYHLQTRTFWSQMSTIWEWFIANFSSEPLAERGHARPVHIYAVADGEWQAREVVEARLVLEPAVLEFGSASIDRKTREWVNADSQQSMGFCQRLPLWDALEYIELHSIEGAS